MEIEFFNIHNPNEAAKYFPILEKWWLDWGWEAISPQFLSTTGAIIKHEEEYICAAWLYQTDSLMCIVDFVISAKKRFAGNLKQDALKFLIIKLEKLAKTGGFRAVFSCSQNKSLINLLLELDYGRDSKTGRGDENMTAFIKRI